MNYLHYFKDLSEKFKPTIDAVKTDLNEIKDYLIPGTTNLYIQNSTDFAKKQIVEGSKLFKDSINTILNAHQSSSLKSQHKWDKMQVLLLQIQENDNTYLTDYSSEPSYETWDQNFNLEDENCLELLNSSEMLKNKHEQLVPSKIDENQFWKRYLYKVYLLDQDEKMRQSLLQRATNTLKDDLAWDGNEDDWEITSSIISQDQPDNQNKLVNIEDESNIINIENIPEIHGTTSKMELHDKEAKDLSSKNKNRKKKVNDTHKN